jgi:hypothetical protein
VWKQSVKEKYGLWMKEGEEWFFTVRTFEGPLPAFTIQVNYEGFAEGIPQHSVKILASLEILWSKQCQIIAGHIMLRAF